MASFFQRSILLLLFASMAYDIDFLKTPNSFIYCFVCPSIFQSKSSCALKSYSFKCAMSWVPPTWVLSIHLGKAILYILASFWVSDGLQLMMWYIVTFYHVLCDLILRCVLCYMKLCFIVHCVVLGVIFSQCFYADKREEGHMTTNVRTLT